MKKMAYCVIFLVMLNTVSPAEILFNKEGVMIEYLEGEFYFYSNALGRFLTNRFAEVAVSYHRPFADKYYSDEPDFAIVWSTEKKYFIMALPSGRTTPIAPWSDQLWYEASMVLAKCHKVPPSK